MPICIDIMVLRLILWPFYVIQGDRGKKWMFCYSDNVEKELKYNQCLFTSSIDSLPSKRTVLFQRNRHPKFGDTLETILMAPLQSVFCASTTQPKVTPTNHHWNGGSITSLSSPFLPSSSRWSSQCQLLHLNLSGSFLSPAMWSTPRGPSWILRRWRTSWWWNATWDCLIPWASKSELLPFWLIYLISSTFTWINLNAS